MMSNNRMWFVHKATGKRILLCKYYPGTNWYRFHEINELDGFLDSLPHADDINLGDTGFELQFEIDNDESDNAQS